MRPFLTSIRLSTVSCCMLVLPVLIATQAVPVEAQDAHAIAGAQSADKGRQALAFLPNELWIHAGESITWTFPTDENHTVTFLKPGQIRPAFQKGCPGTTADGSSYTGAACVNSGTLVSGQTYTVNFPAAGNFKLVCLVHLSMTGAVHVLDAAQPLPHDQAFYDREADRGRSELLLDGLLLAVRGRRTADRMSPNEVSAGIGETVATGGGSNTVSVMRFLRGTTFVHVGDTVEWTNLESVTRHTVTFGADPANPMLRSPGMTVDADGALHAVVGAPVGNLNSGYLQAARQDGVGLAQLPLSVTRFRVTFTTPGTFDYFCALHDELGMKGTVVVNP